MAQYWKDCLECCFPRRKKAKPASPDYRVGRYNAQLRRNLGLPERDIELPPSIQQYAPSERMTATRDPSPGRSQPQPRIPMAVNTGEAPNFTLTFMYSAELRELFTLMHEVLEHIPYAICGLGALIDQYQFTRRNAKQISIICPSHSKDNVMNWAQTRGCVSFGNSIGFKMSSGAIRKVRVKYVDDFSTLQLSKSMISSAKVLSKTSTLDHIAAGWLDNYKRKDEKALKTIANDIFYCLDYVVKTRSKLDEEYLHTFLGSTFFLAFTEAHPRVRVEMARASIDIAGVLARLRNNASLREHDEMLKQFGLEGDIAMERPGAFENVRDLSQSKSVYTLRDSKTESQLWTPDVPGVPGVSATQTQEDKKGKGKAKETALPNPKSSKPLLTRKWNSLKGNNDTPKRNDDGRGLTKSNSTNTKPGTRYVLDGQHWI
ncbi:hypothetical protein GGR57DRAFT_176466 [Xylariaceae sp. FL1272]|nr:hypothetical protein GGR57DRAFT_176466 [Xylariaceae sp. FL1272]